jgi:hypothetical protein
MPQAAPRTVSVSHRRPVFLLARNRICMLRRNPQSASSAVWTSTLPVGVPRNLAEIACWRHRRRSLLSVMFLIGRGVSPLVADSEVCNEPIGCWHEVVVLTRIDIDNGDAAGRLGVIVPPGRWPSRLDRSIPACTAGGDGRLAGTAVAAGNGAKLVSPREGIAVPARCAPPIRTASRRGHRPTRTGREATASSCRVPRG